MSDKDTAIVTMPDDRFLTPVINVRDAQMRYQAQKEFIGSILQENIDFGAVPGTDKKTLLKPGAEKMASYFGLTPVFEDVETVEDWTGEQHGGEPFFYYRQKCKLYRGEHLKATADGSCNSWEKKYRYRSADRVCPECGKPTIFKSKPPKTGFYCWSKRGGCGAQFQANDGRITEQELGQIKNPDVAELVNTILKMAQKRALVAVTLIATNTSEYFTQDVEDFVLGDVIDTEFVVKQPAMPTPKPINKQPKPDTVEGEYGEAETREPMSIQYADLTTPKGTRLGDMALDELRELKEWFGTQDAKRGLTAVEMQLLDGTEYLLQREH